jgi:hypothetical protein
MIAADREPDRKRGRELMQQLIGSVGHTVLAALREVVTLGRTLRRRAVDVLAYFDRPGTSNGSTAAAGTLPRHPARHRPDLLAGPMPGSDRGSPDRS